ncbi:ubiquinone-binding protein [Brevirhabdus pacifica]|uniref:Ubiquinone-binding protein n=1 Tax=Brevirhabdus pacifica TaxID=1267768 RepID=A0A1U7DF29_9RHOB|nr:type II toxin-antitoxin system RatA family toxin [Brevirhabdus pacifica]APX88607.1 ubiquinone-binding protein [Brevirhabdus pacifica]OWU79889.1 cyclase [Loktanella sp. 22II-4b]PJJ86899.1 coenzyme Q-binding protein COQ10 [Brevirhabdus pacifica]
MPTHSEQKILPYTAAQMFALVADVESYPEFLPWCAAARIRSRRPFDGTPVAGDTPAGDKAEGAEVLEADLVISFKVFRERFGSRVVLWPREYRIDTSYLDGPFRYMESRWQFTDLPEGGCSVDFHVDFEFRNRVLQGVVGVVFNEAMQRIVRAFERRAAELYAQG